MELLIDAINKNKVAPSRKHTFKANNFIFTTNAGDQTGRRERGFFLCPLTGEYDFFLSCAYSCQWSIKETEQSGKRITEGSYSQSKGGDKQLSQIIELCHTGPC